MLETRLNRTGVNCRVKSQIELGDATGEFDKIQEARKTIEQLTLSFLSMKVGLLPTKPKMEWIKTSGF